MQGGRKLSDWNIFVKKVYAEGKAKDSSYEFKQALTDASERKSEMGSMKSVTASGIKKGKNKKSRKIRRSRKMSLALAGGTRKRRRH
jgi:biopolymer transport protein ExbB/TolQ